METSIPKELIEAYKSTNFTVFSPAISIRVGEISEALEALLLEKGVREWAYITSINPYSRIHSKEENEQFFEALKEDVSPYTNYLGEGVGTDPDWEAEKSLLILGIEREKAIELGKKYGQNAIVFGEAGGEAELLLLR